MSNPYEVAARTDDQRTSPTAAPEPMWDDIGGETYFESRHDHWNDQEANVEGKKR